MTELKLEDSVKVRVINKFFGFEGKVDEIIEPDEQGRTISVHIPSLKDSGCSYAMFKPEELEIITP